MIDNPTFGQFLAKNRIAKNMTQKQLAEILYVEESTISKWEKDKRKPDIDFVQKLAEIFGITESELIRASVDKRRERDRKQAKIYRGVTGTINLGLTIAFGIALLATFIVNLATSQTLSWFWIVLGGLIIPTTILILPKYITIHRLALISGSFVDSIILLLLIVNIYLGFASWFWIASVALLFAYSVVFTPLLLKEYFPKFKKHLAAIAVAISSVMLIILLIVIDACTTGSFGWSFKKALPIALLGIIMVDAIVGLLCYTKIRWEFKTATVIAIIAVSNNLLNGLLKLVGIDSDNPYKANLTEWSTDYINGNVFLIINIVMICAALTFALLGAIKFAIEKSAKKLG